MKGKGHRGPVEACSRNGLDGEESTRRTTTGQNRVLATFLGWRHASKKAHVLQTLARLCAVFGDKRIHDGGLMTADSSNTFME